MTKINKTGSFTKEVTKTGAIVYYSYNTPVAIETDNCRAVTLTHYSSTTSRHCNSLKGFQKVTDYGLLLLLDRNKAYISSFSRFML